MHRYLEHFKEGGGHWKGKIIRLTNVTRMVQTTLKSSPIACIVMRRGKGTKLVQNVRNAKWKCCCVDDVKERPSHPKNQNCIARCVNRGETEQVCNRCQRPMKGPRKGLNKNIKKSTG